MKLTTSLLFILICVFSLNCGFAFSSDIEAQCYRWPEGTTHNPLLSGKLTENLFFFFYFVLGSFIYSAIPSGGYPIRFHRGGIIESKNLSFVDEWRIGETNNLQLLHKGEVKYDFRYNESCGTLVHTASTEDKHVNMEINLNARSLTTR